MVYSAQSWASGATLKSTVPPLEQGRSRTRHAVAFTPLGAESVVGAEPGRNEVQAAALLRHLWRSGKSAMRANLLHSDLPLDNGLADISECFWNSADQVDEIWPNPCPKRH